jgi:hypothetical protein
LYLYLSSLPLLEKERRHRHHRHFHQDASASSYPKSPTSSSSRPAGTRISPPDAAKGKKKPVIYGPMKVRPFVRSLASSLPPPRVLLAPHLHTMPPSSSDELILDAVSSLLGQVSDINSPSPLSLPPISFPPCPSRLVQRLDTSPDSSFSLPFFLSFSKSGRTVQRALAAA